MKIIIKTLLLVQIWFVTNFILLPGASLLPDVTYVHNVLATSLISLLHTCRKYVKSQKARGGYRHTGTHKDTSTLRSTNEETREWWKERQEAFGLMFSFLIPVFLLVNYYIYFNNISINARQVLFRYTLVVQYLAPTAITRYWCYRYRILPVTLYSY